MSARSSTLPVLGVNALYKYSSLKLLNRLTFDPIFVCTLLVIIANRGLKISVVQCWIKVGAIDAAALDPFKA